jgi:serine/threonine protein kinase
MNSAPATTELCPGCFADKGLVNVCPHCGYDESLKRGPLVLPHRTLLHLGQYLIGKVLGKPGGFGITYLALDTKLETRVAIKEYLPRDLAGRDGDHATVSAHSAEDGDFFRYGLTQFLQEARTLARFDHANIVRVRNFFEENGTGYLVMDYYDGITLADYLSQQPQGKLPEKTAVDILMPILDGLREVHAKNFLHRDIKPQNIYLTTGNRAILLDFGAARQAMGERSRSISVVLSEGYAPYEQYHRRGEQGPWTDIYACAAVLYHAVAGQAPPPATERVSKDELDIGSLGVSASLSNALQSGLAVDHKNRPQTMTEFQTLLLGNRLPTAISEVPQKRHETEPRPDAVSNSNSTFKLNKSEITTGKKKPGKRPFWIVLIGLPIVLLILQLVISPALTSRVYVPTVEAPVPVAPETKIVPAATVVGQHAKGQSVTYKVEKTDNYLAARLVATFDGKRLEGPEGEYGLDMKVKDFNGDGVMDAYITQHFGGSGAVTVDMFISVADGKIVEAPFPGGVIVEESGRFLVKSEFDNATEYWGFDGKKAIKVRSVPHRVLETIAEVKKIDDETGTLEADLDMDGKYDKITCDFWWRYGAYKSCTLPLPGGTTQVLDLVDKGLCNRVGVLKTQSNGYRELVCNNNAVIRFNGKTWVQLKPDP